MTANHITNIESALDMEKEINDLVDLKFLIEKEYHIIHNIQDKPPNYYLKSFKHSDISKIFESYKKNIQINLHTILKNYREIIENINDFLMKNCNHNWIDDVIETPFSEKNICYCNKCFIYK